MNRRNFISGLMVAGASFMVLPGTGRLWTVARPELVTRRMFVLHDFDWELLAETDGDPVRRRMLMWERDYKPWM